ncbi:MAG: hypothetical protein EBX36_11760 [Planctomycetia bacterium]|nr:hypothetical protein [Planctomycetia bacterium]
MSTDGRHDPIVMAIAAAASREAILREHGGASDRRSEKQPTLVARSGPGVAALPDSLFARREPGGGNRPAAVLLTV